MIKTVIFNKLWRRSINLSGVYGAIGQRNRGVNHGKIKHTRGMKNEENWLKFGRARVKCGAGGVW